MSRFLIVLMMGLGLYGQTLPDLTVASISTTNVTTDTQSLLVSGTLGVTVRNLGAPVATVFRVVAWEDRDGNGVLNAGTDVTLGSAASNGTIATGGDQVVVIPIAGRVLFRGNRIFVKVDSGESVGESNELNNVSNTSLIPSAGPAVPLAPFVKWHKEEFVVRPDSKQVMMAPVVIDMNGDGTPDVVFSTHIVSNFGTGGILRAISGKDGSDIWSLTDPRYLVRGEASVAVGDIDGDGRPEVIAVHESGALMAVEHDGTFKWLSEVLPTGRYYAGFQWGGASLVDLNHDGSPEIVFGATVLRSNGTTLWKGTAGRGDGGVGPLSVPVDLDLDGNLEIVAGHTAYRADGTILWTVPGIADAFVGVGNFDSDPRPEVVLVSDGQVYLVSSDGKVMWGPVPVPGGGGGPPTVADMDGDGVPEIGVAGSNRYVVFKKDGSILWQATTRDNSSFQTGSSVFDFEGDGKAEVIYGDELNLRIYRGSDGTVLYTLPKSSCTTYELPVIADVDGDKKADILAVANQTCGYGPQSGVYLISGANWVNTRSIWNQHTYHVTNVNDDGTIPRFEQPNWLVPGLNNFRLNTFSQPGLAGGLPDLTSSLIRKDDGTFPATVRLLARVGNGGSATLESLGSERLPGRVLVGNDVNTLSSSLNSAGNLRFASNAIRWLTRGKIGARVLAIRSNTDGSRDYSDACLQLWRSSRYIVELTDRQNWTLAELRTYDAVFVSSNTAAVVPDGEVLKAYVAQGGAVYLTGGVGPSPTAEAAAWAIFLARFGWELAPSYNSLGSITTTSSHPVFSGAPVVTAGNGQDIIVRRPVPGASIILAQGSANLFAAYDGSLDGSDPGGPNLLVNGSFDESNPLCPLAWVNRVGTAEPGNTFMTGWKIVGADIDQFGTDYWKTAGGRCAVNIDGNFGSSGEIEQLVATEAGALYELRWQMSGHPGGGLANPIRVKASGKSADFDFDSTSGTGPNLGWEQYRWRFRATGPSTAIRFHSLTTILNIGAGFGANIDEAELRRISETTTGAPGTIAVSFYRGDPASGGTLIGTTRTSKSLAPGEFEDVSVTWSNPTAGLHPIVVVADDNGSGIGVISESDETNNKAGANILLGVGPFPLVDSLLTRFKDKAVDLEWAAVPSASSYTLYRRSGLGSLSVVQRGLLTTRFSDANLTNGTAYSYVVRWVNGAGLESADGTEASAVPTPDVRTDGTPPTILSNPLTRARALARYSNQVAAGDPDAGEVLTYSLTSAPVGMTISGTGLIEWTPSLQQFGYFNVTVRVQDRTLKFAAQTFRLFTEVETINNPPVITSGPISTGASGETYSYRVLARDPDAGDLLTYSLVAGPTGMSMNPATGLISWLPTRQQVASHPITIRVTDLGGLRAEQSFAILVARGNTAPRFTSLPVTFTRAGSGYRYQPTAMDAESDPLTYRLDSVAPAAAVTVDGAAGTVAWAVPTGTVFEVTIRVTDDGGLSATQAYRITVGAANQPPVISSTAVTTAVANVSYRYAVTATDPNLPDEALTYSLVIAPVGMTIAPLTGVIDWVPGATVGGTNVNVAVRVTDQAGLTATQAFVVTVRPPDLTRPAVSLLGPANGSTLTNDAPVTGTVTDDNLRLWRVEYRTVDAADWRVLSTGTTNVPTAGSLGTFPATLLANDVYRMRLYAEDAGGSVTSPEIEVTIDTKQLKMGDFTLTYEDLRLSAGAFPLTIQRKYDSKRPQRGDFGPGWTLAFNEVDVRIDVNKNVFLTLPDGRRVGFVYTPTCLSVLFGACLFGAYTTGYTPQPGVYDELTSLDCPQTIAGTCGFSPFEPKDWLLTTTGGVKYTIRSGKVTRMEDRAGNWMIITPSGVQSNSGRNVAFQRDGAGRIVTLVDPKNNSIRYEYDGAGRLSKYQDQAGSETAYEYLAESHFITSIRAPGGCVPLRNEYGPDGRVTAKSDNGGARFVYAFDVTERKQRVTNPLGSLTVTDFDERGNVVAETDGLGNKTTYAYDANNNRLTTTFPSRRSTIRTYGSKGTVLTESNAPTAGPSLTTSYTYNSYSQIETITNPGGEKIVFAYDSKGNVLRREDRNAGDVFVRGDSFAYDASGRRISAINGEGKETRYSYDTFGAVTSSRDPAGAVTRFEYDLNGAPSAVVDAGGMRTELSHNSMNLLAEVRRGGQPIAKYSYNDLGKPLTRTDAMGRVTAFGYDCKGEMVRVTDPAGNVTAYEVDALTNLTRITDPLNGQTRFGFDAANRPSSRTSPEGGGWGFSWNSNSALVAQSGPNGGSIFSRQFDRYGRLGEETDPSASFSYTYDSNGRVSNVAKSGGGAWSFVYDGSGQVLSSIAPQGGQAITYKYDRRGLRTSMTTPDGWTTNYTYNDAGRIEVIATGASTARFSYDLVGRRTRVLYGNGASTNYAYDGQGRLSSVSILNAGGGVVSSYAYTLDANGNRTASRFADGNATFGLDNLNRLTSETINSTSLGSVSRNYRYDAVGNRLDSGATFGADYRILSDVGGAFTNDANGNRIVRGTKRYGYDSASHLINFSEGAVAASYRYDFTGRRVSRTLGAVATEFLYDGLSIAVEYPSDGPSLRYTHGLGIDEILMQTRGTQTYFYHADALGSIVAITDASGNAVQRYGYDAWGNMIQNTGSFSFSAGPRLNRFGFTGRELDVESGLYHFRARAYDPLSGRFLQKDPLLGSLSNPTSQHPYVYAANNPANALDPTGEFVLGGYLALLEGNDATKGAASAIGALAGFGVSNLQFLGQFLQLTDRGDLTLAERWEQAVQATEDALTTILSQAGQIESRKAIKYTDVIAPCVEGKDEAKVKLSVGGGIANAFFSGSAYFSSGIGLKLDFGLFSIESSVKREIKVGGFKCGYKSGVDRLRLMRQ